MAARWPGTIEPGQVIEDFVNIMDVRWRYFLDLSRLPVSLTRKASPVQLAPTFCEAGGIPPPASMTARSVLPLLRSGASGQIDPRRDHVVTGRERHVVIA